MEWILVLSLYAGAMSSSGVGLTHIDGFGSYQACSEAGEQFKSATNRGYYRCITVKRSGKVHENL